MSYGCMNRYELILRVQDLQKQLIDKSDAVIERERKIKKEEEAYVALKTIISRQPGPEVEEQILVYQQTLKEKSKQLKAMEEELAMYREQVGIFNGELTTIDTEMSSVKLKWIKSIRSKP